MNGKEIMKNRPNKRSRKMSVKNQNEENIMKNTEILDDFSQAIATESPLKPTYRKFFKNRSPGKKLKLSFKRVGVSKGSFNVSYGSKKVKNSESRTLEKENLTIPNKMKSIHVSKNLFDMTSSEVSSSEEPVKNTGL